MALVLQVVAVMAPSHARDAAPPASSAASIKEVAVAIPDMAANVDDDDDDDEDVEIMYGEKVRVKRR